MISSCDLLSILCALARLNKDDERRRRERRIERKVSIEAESVREKIEFGGREPIRFCIG